MKRDAEGRPFALVSRQDNAETLEVHPEIWNALVFMIGAKSSGSVQLHFMNGVYQRSVLNVPAVNLPDVGTNGSRLSMIKRTQ